VRHHLYAWEYQVVQESAGAVQRRVVPTARYTAAVGEAVARRLEMLLAAGTPVRVETPERSSAPPPASGW
jgi:hypothetical protein